MTGRERLTALLRKQPVDRLAWTTLVDNASLAGFPVELRGNGGIDFYRSLGCDIFLLNGWNTPHHFATPELRWDPAVTVECQREGTRQTTVWRTGRETLTGIWDRSHPVKYPVDSLAAVRVYRAMWEGAQYVAGDDCEPWGALDRLIGEAGVVTRFWGPSTIPRLLEEDMGLETFYYLLADHPAEMAGLIAVMHEREIEAFRLMARGPWDSVTLVENTSTAYISPPVYERFNMPHQRDFVAAVQAQGKVALLHMCGHVRGLLDLIKETGCDGIHALTPPPTGDCPWEQALDVLGNDLVIVGCLDPTIFAGGPVEGIGPALDRLITPRLREAHFVLGPMADGLPIELARFRAVQRWMERGGRSQ